MNDQVFLDTGYVLALELANDQYHQIAQQHWTQVTTTLPVLVTTSYVFDEVVTYFNRIGHHAKAVTVGDMLLHSSSVHLVQVEEALFYAGWSYFQSRQDKDYSLTDCISFVVMEHLGLTVAYAFDKHFEQAGFLREPL